MQKIFSQRAMPLIFLLCLSLATIFLILPLGDLGQREHLLIILTMPYLLLVSYRLQNNSFSIIPALGIGLLAGLGFTIKPHYLVLPLSIEIYYIYCTRKFFAWSRPETLTILLFSLTYALSIFVYYPDYLFINIPIAVNLYLPGTRMPLINLLLFGPAVFCYFAVFLCISRHNQNPYKSLCNILSITLIDYLVIYLLQGTTWHYHLLPAFSIAMLLIIFQCSQFELQADKNMQTYLIWIIIFAFPCHAFNRNYLSSVAYKDGIMPLILFMRGHTERKSVYFFSTSPSFSAFPAVDYSNTRPTARVACLAWIPWYLKQINLPIKNSYRQKLIKDRNFLINMTINDLITKKPDFVFIDISEKKAHLANKKFDHLEFFLKNIKFNSIWKHYHYLTKVEDTRYHMYTFAVYQQREK